MLQTIGLSYSYDGNTQIRFPDINCPQGSQWLLLGDSGTGKTTLLHLLGGLRKVRQGQILVKDKDLAKMSESDLDYFRGQHIGIIFQTPHFLRALTVQENLRMAQQLAGKIIDDQRITSLLSRLQIDHKLHKRTDQLSQGEQQRLAIARALINKPAVILADEPTSALDDHNCEQVYQLLTEQANAENATLLIVTHDGRLKSRFENSVLLPKLTKSN